MIPISGFITRNVDYLPNCLFLFLLDEKMCVQKLVQIGSQILTNARQSVLIAAINVQSEEMFELNSPLQIFTDQRQLILNADQLNDFHISLAIVINQVITKSIKIIFQLFLLKYRQGILFNFYKGRSKPTCHWS